MRSCMHASVCVCVCVCVCVHERAHGLRNHIKGISYYGHDERISETSVLHAVLPKLGFAKEKTAKNNRKPTWGGQYIQSSGPRPSRLMSGSGDPTL